MYVRLRIYPAQAACPRRGPGTSGEIALFRVAFDDGYCGAREGYLTLGTGFLTEGLLVHEESF